MNDPRAASAARAIADLFTFSFDDRMLQDVTKIIDNAYVPKGADGLPGDARRIYADEPIEEQLQAFEAADAARVPLPAEIEARLDKAFQFLPWNRAQQEIRAVIRELIQQGDERTLFEAALRRYFGPPLLRNITRVGTGYAGWVGDAWIGWQIARAARPLQGTPAQCEAFLHTAATTLAGERPR